MIIKKLFENSIYTSIGYINSKETVELYAMYLQQNAECIKNCKYIYICVNSDDILLFNQFAKTVFDIFPDAVVDKYSINRGHTVGTMDLDNACMKYASKLDCEYIIKTSLDIIYTNELLNIEVPNDVDFYYYNNIGASVTENKNIIDDIMNKQYFYPQTNFYIIRNKINCIYDNDYINKGYELYCIYKQGEETPWQTLSRINYVPFCCEQLLANKINELNMSTYLLTSKQTVIKLIDTINKYTIHDGSHKNITYSDLGGLCHIHYFNGLKVILVI